MALPDIKDVGIVADFVRWGYPWHGLATAGVVPVSNHSITQPLGGDTYVQRFAGVQPLTMTPARIAADAVLGMTWLDYAVLSGANQQLYGGANLGPLGWIYGAADGRKWWIKLTSAGTITGNSQTFTFAVKLFGKFNGIAETYTRTVILSDIGQGTPAAEFHSSIEGGYGGYDCVVNSYELYLEDIKPDGAKAVLGLRNNCADSLLNWTPRWWAGEKVSMGFLVVDVTDGTSGPDITVSVLHNRATALGSVVTTNGHTSTDRIIAVWFDGDGVPLPVKLGLDFPVNFVDAIIPCPGSGGTSSSADHVWSFAWGDQSASFTASLAGSTSGTCSEVAVPGGTSYVTTVDFHYSYTFSGLFSADSTWSLETSYAGVSFFSVNSMRWTAPSAIPSNLYHGCGLFRIGSGGGGTYTGDEFMWAIKRISNKHFGLLAMKFPAGTVYQADAYSAWSQSNDMVWVGGFTPAGADALAGSLGIQPDVVPTGSVQPVTNLPFLSASGAAICYV